MAVYEDEHTVPGVHVVDGASTTNGATTLNGATEIVGELDVSGIATFAKAVTFSGALTLPADTVDSDEIAAGAIDLAHMSANSVDSDQYVNASIDNAHLADDAVDSDELAAGAVDGVHMGGGSRVNTVDTACTLDTADAFTTIDISSTSGAGTFTIAVGTLPAGLLVTVWMSAFDTNAYTAAVQGGTVTFNAVDELATFMYDGTVLRHISLVGATFA